MYNTAFIGLFSGVVFNCALYKLQNLTASVCYVINVQFNSKLVDSIGEAKQTLWTKLLVVQPLRHAASNSSPRYWVIVLTQSCVNLCCELSVSFLVFLYFTLRLFGYVYSFVSSSPVFACMIYYWNLFVFMNLVASMFKPYPLGICVTHARPLRVCFTAQRQTHLSSTWPRSDVLCQHLRMLCLYQPSLYRRLGNWPPDIITELEIFQTCRDRNGVFDLTCVPVSESICLFLNIDAIV